MPAARRGPAVGPRAPPQPDLLHPWRAQRGDPRPPRWAQRPADEEARRQPACPLRATRPPRPTTPAGRPLTSWPAGSGAASTSTYHVLVERHAYSVPFQLLREPVEVRYTTTTVEVFFKGRRVTSHRRRYDGQPSTVAEHMPSAHRAHAEWTPSRLLRWAEKAGPATGQLVDRILRSRPHPRAGVPGRARHHALGAAARQRPARRGERPRHRPRLPCRFDTVRNILAAGQDRLPFEPPAATSRRLRTTTSAAPTELFEAVRPGRPRARHPAQPLPDQRAAASTPEASGRPVTATQMWRACPDRL